MTDAILFRSYDSGAPVAPRERPLNVWDSGPDLETRLTVESILLPKLFHLFFPWWKISAKSSNTFDMTE